MERIRYNKHYKHYGKMPSPIRTKLHTDSQHAVTKPARLTAMISTQRGFEFSAAAAKGEAAGQVAAAPAGLGLPLKVPQGVWAYP